MRKYGRIIILTAAVLSFAFYALAVKADVGAPGSESDPLVTKSYVEKLIMNMKQYVDAKASGPDNLEVVNLKKGESITGAQGTEIILRSGQAVVIDSAGGGLSDLTGGKDLKKGEKILPNHLILVPRDDGRGLKAQSDAVLLVRGNYTIAR
ncbi:MAG: hypothetical protein PWQ97_214 [Tepidanaerobacteraceae bacterium]|nr:hypothetical protein [Tepidanaerobacteraceae bacterium]